MAMVLKVLKNMVFAIMKSNYVTVELIFLKSSPINDNTKVVAIQRSKGYDQRPSITINEIEQAITSIKEVYPNIIILLIIVMENL